MKLRLFLLALLFPFFLHAQERGAGVRLGEPFSLTYKDFFEDYWSFEIMLGSGGVNSGEYYQKAFENNPPESNAIYGGHSARRGISLNFRMALHEDFTDMFEITQGYLLGYAGAGVQIRTTYVDYRYFLTPSVPGNPNLNESRTNFDLGPEVFAGAEYYFDELPISVFAEIGLYLELIDRINMRGQGGIGVRYLF
ncbi:hypothetical protein Aoki45_18920 [Algoriphagus sp. oki45]|uniref:Outer membrane protein beta-barrel domain-containing protein n=1 Tax=Algoriphagus confluentis TaxID=1697556 RepID=A0ABQ6PR62_9BACT|nr:hypothetical protein Aoki45_18920 [Algoriphagus sp. oki45]GMQ30416.1 hypothetical protein Aconfl_30590 [Algoriphagus confluentis]